MRLDGWDYVPRGYGLRLDVRADPLWLRCLYRSPFLDRFAYPLLVRRGHAYLTAHPGWTAAQREVVPDVGWRVEVAAADVRPGEVVDPHEG